jgi:acetyl-CoA carboxylase biotin carboxyl carrier protein
MANLESPMVGKILEINIAVGDTIAEDDEIMVIEAMKMENPIFATEGGVVKEIKCKEGQTVTEGEVIVVLG